MTVTGKKPEDNNHLTSPMPAGKWAKVLDAFPELTLNFARFGSQHTDCKPARAGFSLTGLLRRLEMTMRVPSLRGAK